MSSSASEALALDIILSLRHQGHAAYLVGGCVRDRLLGLPPQDFAVSTSAPPDLLTRLFPGSQIVGTQFGVVLVHRGDPVQVEVATFRSEGKYVDGRRPSVVQFVTDPARDAQRRDFTINGLFEDPFTGNVLDFVGGQADLGAKLVRAIGDPARRFAEDHLRMLRAVRFAARLRFAIDPQTLAAMQELAPAILGISRERIRDELVRILTEGGAKQGLELLDQSGLLAPLLPEIKAFQGVAQPPQYHPEGDVWSHVLLMLDALPVPAAPALAAAVLLHDVGKPSTFRLADRIRFDGHAEVGAAMTRKILDRLRFSNDDADHITSLVANHMRFKDVQGMRKSTLKRFLALPRFEDHLELHRLDCLASNGYTASYDFVREKQKEFRLQDLQPAPLITGRDLIGLGLAPGPEFRRILTEIETAQLEGEIHTRAEALALARLRFPPVL